MHIDHIQLAIPKGGEPSARSFFIDLLGMVEEQKPYPLSERGGAWFCCGDTSIHVGVDADFIPQKKAHPAFLIEDLDALATSLLDAGYAVKWDKSLPNRKRFFTSDPFGNRIEFMHYGHGFTQTII